jgi:hypothetical protein
MPILANAYNIPVYGVCLGSEVKQKDMQLRLTHSFYTVFEGQNVIITPELLNTNMNNSALKIEITDEKNQVITSQKVNIKKDSAIKLKFKIPAPLPGLHSYSIRIASEKKLDDNPENDSAPFSMNVIKTKLKILLIEGRPFWDTKFLARVYTDNAAIDLTSIYRLTNERFFQVSEDKKNIASNSVIFPENIEELSKYNLIVLGKGIEFFLNDKKIALLKTFIRDYGGALIFSRGKPYSGKWKAFNSLEPVEWGSKLSGLFKWQPTEEGTECGLFGEMLPNTESNIWNELPTIKGALSCPGANSFSQILVQGNDESNSNLKVPVLISRRFGKGIILAVNSQDLWKWDFFPLNGETAEFYKNFWTQLVFWTISYSDFMPNKNYSIKLSKNSAAPDEKIYININSKIQLKKQPKITIFKAGNIIKKIIPAQVQPKSWNALCSFSKPGIYKIALLDDKNYIDIFEPLKIITPPQESNNQSADPLNFSTMLEATGGKLVNINELKHLLKNRVYNTLKIKKNKQWISTWDKWYLLLIILLFTAAECRMRRKNGLL